MKTSTRIVLANSSACRIYDYHLNPKELIFIRELLHPSSKLKDIELMSDRPGHYKANNSARGTYESRTDPKEVEIDKFTQEIAKELAKTIDDYENLVLITPPHCFGLLSKHLNKHIKDKIMSSLKKDYLHLSENELKIFLHENWLELRQ